MRVVKIQDTLTALSPVYHGGNEKTGLRAVDEYARRHGVSRSEVIRRAIQELIDMRCALEELDRARGGPLRVVALRLPRDLLDALGRRAAMLKATRAAVVRYAIHQLLQKVKQETEP